MQDLIFEIITTLFSVIMRTPPAADRTYDTSFADLAARGSFRRRDITARRPGCNVLVHHLAGF